MARETSPGGRSLEDLSARARSGDRTALTLLIEHCGRAIARGLAAAGYTPSFGDYEDAQQDALVAIVDRFPGAGAVGSPCGWMHTVARNRAVARTRSKEARRRALERLRRVQPPGPVDDDFGVEEVPSVHELASLVLGGLRPIYRDVVVAYYLDELSVEEISRELGLPADTIYTRLRRARRAMLQVLREHGHG